MSQELQHFAEDIQQGTAKTISDGSYKDYITTSAFKAIQTPPSFQGTTVTPG